MDDEALFEDAPCAYLVLTPDGHITRANTAFRRWTGRDDPVGLDLRQALPPGARVYLDTHVLPMALMRGRAPEVALDLVRADGSRLPVLLDAVAVHDAAGVPVAVRAVLLETTRRAAQARELRRMRDRELIVRAWTERLLALTERLAAAQTPQAVVLALVDAVSQADPDGTVAVLVGEGDGARLAGSRGATAHVDGLVARVRAGETGGDGVTVLPMGTEERVLGTLARLAGPGGADPEGAVRFVRACALQGGAALERTRLLAELARRALTDDLTALPNRRAGLERLDAELARARRGGAGLCVALIDIDHFKRFNDTHGHAAGDALLRDAAARWRDVLRATDLLARYGGEEFLLIMGECGWNDAIAVCERVRTATPRATCSIGVAEWDRHEEAAGVIARADDALYLAKRGGRDRVETAPVA